MKTFTCLFLLALVSIPAAAPAAPPAPTGRELYIEKTPRSYRSDSRHNLKWQYAFRLGGAYSGMLDNNYRSLESGFGFDGDVIARVNRNVSLRISIGTSGINTNENYNSYIRGGFFPPEYEIVSSDFEYNAIRYFASLQFNSATMRTGMTGLEYFIYFGLGGIYHDASLTSVYKDNINNRLLLFTTDMSGSDLAFTAGLGSMILLNRHWGIDFTFSTDIILGRPGYTTDGINVPDYDGTYDFKFGLLYLL